MAKTFSSEPLVVIFGGAGYIGSVLTRRLLWEGFRVRVFDNFLFGREGMLGLVEPCLEVIEGDICDTGAVSSAVKGADSVVLLSAIIGRREEEVRRNNMRDINLLASSVVLDASVEHGASRFVFASTDSVYGVQSGVMYETGTPEPKSLFSRLKLRMEERVIKAKQSGFHPTALRVATCHGYSPRMRFDLVLNTLVRDAICKKRIDIQGGEQWRALVHVDDVASAFIACLKAHFNLISGEVFNVGANGQNVQVKHLAHMVKTALPEANIFFHEAAPDLTDYHLSCAKIEKILDFTPRWTLEQSIEELQSMLREGRFEDPFSVRYLNT